MQEKNIETYERLVTKMIEENKELIKQNKADEAYRPIDFEEIKKQLMELQKEPNKYIELTNDILLYLFVTSLGFWVIYMFIWFCYMVVKWMLS